MSRVPYAGNHGAKHAVIVNLDARPELTGAVLGIARHVVGADALDADDDLVSHGAGSLALARIIAIAALELGVDLDLGRVSGPLTPSALARSARSPAASRPNVGTA